MTHPFIFWGAANAALAVAMGAFGAHGLKAALAPDLLAVYPTGAQYHIFHALGLLLVGVIASHRPGSLVTWSGWLIFAGILLFSGSLYVLAVSGERWLGMITPFGGTAFIAGWVLLALAGLKRPSGA